MNEGMRAVMVSWLLSVSDSSLPWVYRGVIIIPSLMPPDPIFSRTSNSGALPGMRRGTAPRAGWGHPRDIVHGLDLGISTRV